MLPPARPARQADLVHRLAARLGAAVPHALLAFALLAPSALGAQSPRRRPLEPEDANRVRDVRDARISPDGEWVAYSVSTADSAKDKNRRQIWMASWDGSREVQLTRGTQSASDPRWSPDGKWLAFLSSRDDDHHVTQLWLLPRAGGEAERATKLDGDIEEYAWSPDGKRLVLVVDDPDSAALAGDSAPPRPVVIDRYLFKDDERGWLGTRRRHLRLFDLETRTATPLTSGQYEEQDPAWSPDGKLIAFVSRRRPADPDRGIDDDVFVIEPRAGATPRAVASTPAQESGPLAWSPDGRTLAFMLGGGVREYAYGMSRLAIVPVDGGASRVLGAALDRGVDEPVWTPDGRAIDVVVTDDRSRWVARIPVDGGAVEHRTPAGRVVQSLTSAANGRLAVLAASDSEPFEVHAIDAGAGSAAGALRRLSHRNDAWLASVRLARTEEFSSRSRDGTAVHGLLTYPLGYQSGRRVPLLLRIHGGPNGQDEHALHLERQLFASHGYAVLQVNYRGSSGRGAAYQRAILGDWGHKEVIDLLGAVDRAVAMGVADPDRLGIGGWSYGGILTDYTIATDRRFKGATSGAGSANQTAMYGVDEYVMQYDAELGPPWKSEALWMKVSYPFFHADRITTPTLFLGGDQDNNVPLVGGEQMYQALRSLGVRTELIVYPGEHHGISRPSFKRDRLTRYLAWYDRYVRGVGGAEDVRTAGGTR